MPTVAEQLRSAREAQRLDIYQVAEITKIKTDHLRALESGDYDVFTAPVYIRGFVRAYANMLKIDVATVLAQLDTELKQSPKFREPPPLTNQPRSPLDFLTLQLSKLNWRIMVAVVAGLIVLYFAVGWIRGYAAKKSDPLKKLGPGLYQQPGGNSGEKLPLPPAEKR